MFNPVRPGDQIKASMFNQLRAAIGGTPIGGGNGMNSKSLPGGNLVAPNQRPAEFRFGIIVTAGPDSEADYTDNRYWVQWAKVDNTEADDDTADFSLVTITDTSDVYYGIVTVTNIGESVAGTHSLAAETPVQVWYSWDRGSPPTKRYWCEVGSNSSVVTVSITGNTGTANYTGNIQQGKATDLSGTGITNDGPAVLVRNKMEEGSTTTPFLSSGDVIIGVIKGVDTSSGKPIVWTRAVDVNGPCT